MGPLLATLARSDAPVLATAADARALFLPLLDRLALEQAQIAFLDAHRRPVATARIAGHSCDAVTLPVRSILIHALTLRATALVVAHNHPAGDPDPSAADLAATRTLAVAATSVGIRLLDHLIFATAGCRSLRQCGLL